MYIPIFLLLPTLAAAMPRFEVHWESEKSYEDVDPLVSPWHIRLGDINVGPAGYLGGPSVVTIDSADYCVASCQEDWPDEFCNKYPPEGVPNKPRVVWDWGTKYNITGNLVAEGIKSIHERGGQVLLSYGGRHTATTEFGMTSRSGISAQHGGGESTTWMLISPIPGVDQARTREPAQPTPWQSSGICEDLSETPRPFPTAPCPIGFLTACTILILTQP